MFPSILIAIYSLENIQWLFNRKTAYIFLEKSQKEHSQLGPSLTGELEVAGSTSAGSETFLRGDLIMKNFLWSFSTFR